MIFVSPKEAMRLIGLVSKPRKNRPAGAPISRGMFYNHIRPKLCADDTHEVSGITYVSLKRLTEMYPQLALHSVRGVEIANGHYKEYARRETAKTDHVSPAGSLQGS